MGTAPSPPPQTTELPKLPHRQYPHRSLKFPHLAPPQVKSIKNPIHRDLKGRTGVLSSAKAWFLVSSLPDPIGQGGFRDGISSWGSALRLPAESLTIFSFLFPGTADLPSLLPLFPFFHQRRSPECFLHEPLTLPLPSSSCLISVLIDGSAFPVWSLLPQLMPASPHLGFTRPPLGWGTALPGLTLGSWRAPRGVRQFRSH